MSGEGQGVSGECEGGRARDSGGPGQEKRTTGGRVRGGDCRNKKMGNRDGSNGRGEGKG